MLMNETTLADTVHSNTVKFRKGLQQAGLTVGVSYSNQTGLVEKS